MWSQATLLLVPCVGEYRSKRKTMLRSKYIVEMANTDTAFNAIAPEMSASIAGSRSSLSISRTEGAIVVQIDSCDLASLRAATNSWLRLLMVATEIDAILTEELNPKPHK